MKTRVTEEYRTGYEVSGRVRLEGGRAHIYNAVVFDAPKKFGINGGRIGRLRVLTAKRYACVIDYNRRWIAKPAKDAHKAILAALLKRYDKPCDPAACAGKEVPHVHIDGFGYADEISGRYTPEDIFEKYVEDCSTDYALDGLGEWANLDVRGFCKWSPKLGASLAAAVKAASAALPKFNALKEKLEELR